MTVDTKILTRPILSSAGGQVRFRYRDSQSRKMQERSLSGADFLRLILQHVLPKGFRRARNYGFLHPNKKRLIALLHIVLRVKPRTPLAEAKPRPKFLCACCGAPMRVKRRRLPPAMVDRRRSTDLPPEQAV